MNEVVLKKGRIVVPHFAHKPPMDCEWARGETLAHMEAKRLIAESFTARGIRAEIEWVVPALPSYRRADVMVWSMKGSQVAIELQHTSIDLDEIEARAFAYAGAAIAQMWIPFLFPQIWEEAERCEMEDSRFGYFIQRYPARPFEKWIHGFNFGCVPFYDPAAKTLWVGSFEDHQLTGGGNSWYDQCGQEQYSPVYSRVSRRWKELTLGGPIRLADLRIKPVARTAKTLGNYHWPSGRHVAIFAARTPTLASNQDR